MQGSKVIDTFEQVGHFKVDLYWPWNKSTMIDQFLLR